MIEYSKMTNVELFEEIELFNKIIWTENDGDRFASVEEVQEAFDINAVRAKFLLDRVIIAEEAFLEVLLTDVQAQARKQGGDK